jgi:hypothetical protein
MEGIDRVYYPAAGGREEKSAEFVSPQAIADPSTKHLFSTIMK